MSTGLRTLVLNANYMPISVFPLHSIPAEDAVTRIVGETCYVVAEYDRMIKTPTLEMRWPSIIARNTGMKIKETVTLRKESLYYRDHGLCAYCERPITLSELTYDHVRPKVRGGTLTWDNTVSSCGSCNQRKGSQTASGIWKPKVKVYVPTYWELLAERKKFPISVPDKAWVDYLGDWHAPINIQ